MKKLKMIMFLVTVMCAGRFCAVTYAENAVFMHKSVGGGLLGHGGMRDMLAAKDYIDEVNEIYRTEYFPPPDEGRPQSTQLEGYGTRMSDWIVWFNDYYQGLKYHDCDNGYNRIIMFKRCYPGSNVTAEGVLADGDPFSNSQTIANYKAIFQHPAGSGNVYTRNGYEYKALEDVFAENQDILFVYFTAPPLHYAPNDATNDANAHRARVFNNWVKNEWVAQYNQRNPGLNNVIVYDLFDVLAYPDDHAEHPNRLSQDYGGDRDNSHPNSAGYQAGAAAFSGDGNVLDMAWDTYNSGDYYLNIRIIGNGSVTKYLDQASYSAGDSVTITAIPDLNNNFTSWGGNLSGNANPATIIMDSNKTITAHFEQHVVMTEATYYVDGSLTEDCLDGNYSIERRNGSGSDGIAYNTIQEAAQLAVAGDIVLIREGVYRETLTVQNSGTAEQLITFKAFPGEECQGEYGENKTNCSVILDGSDISSGAGVTIANRNYIRIDGIEIRNFPDVGIYANDSSYITVINCEIRDNNGHGIRGANCNNNLYENNNIYRNYGAGINTPLSDNIVIKGNHIHENYDDGIAGDNMNDVTIEFNHLHSQLPWIPEASAFHSDGISFGHDTGDGIVTNIVIRYNRIYDFTQLIYVPLKDYEGSHSIDGLHIYGNLFFTNEYWTHNNHHGEAPGIFISLDDDDYARNIDIHSNTFGWVGYNAIQIYGGADRVENVNIVNNIFYESGEELSSGAVNVNSDYNLFYAVNPPDYEGSHSISGQDPLFIDYRRHESWDFRLLADSPAIDSGHPEINTVCNMCDAFLDFDGNARPDGAGVDIGAYEYNGIQSNCELTAAVDFTQESNTYHFSASRSSCSGGSIVRYNWGFGDGATDEGENVSHIYTSDGEYVVTLYVYSDTGNTEQTQITVTVSIPIPEEQAEGDLVDKTKLICQNNVIKPGSSGVVEIQVYLKEQGRIKVDLYNSKGRKIKNIADEDQPAGIYPYYWRGDDTSNNPVGAGIYFVHMNAGGKKQTKKIAVIK